MNSLVEIIEELRKRGPIDINELARVEGMILSTSLVQSALMELSGEDGFDAYGYFCSVLAHCGCHPEDSALPETRAIAYERARMVLINAPLSREGVDGELIGI